MMADAEITVVSAPLFLDEDTVVELWFDELMI